MIDEHKTKDELIGELRALRSLMDGQIQKEAERPGKDKPGKAEELLRLILTLSTNFIILSPDEIDDGILDVLKAIGMFAGVDRSCVFQFNENGSRMSNTHEWCIHGVEPRQDHYQDMPAKAFPWLSRKIRNFEIINIPDLSYLPLEARMEKSAYTREGVQSIAAVPILSGGGIIGFLCFHGVKSKRAWPEDTISLMKIIGEIFANAINRKQIAKALRESEERYRNIFDNATEGIFQTTPDGRYISVNPALVRMFEYGSAEEMINSVKDIGAVAYVYREDRERFKKMIEEHGFVEGFETQRRRRDGSIFWTSMNAHAIYNDDGSVKYYEGTVEDITRRKDMEELLRVERETFFAILQNAPHGVLLADRNGDYLYLNPEFTQITGYSLDDIPSGYEWFRKAFPDFEKRSMAMEAWREDVTKKGTVRIFSIVCKNKESKQIEFRPTMLDDGRTITMISDVTERSRSEEMFRTLANNSPVGIYIIQNGRFKFVNPHFQRITGYTMEELVDKGSLSLIVEEDREIARTNAFKMLKGERSSAFEIRVHDKNKKALWILQTVTSIQYEGQRGVLGSFIDITDQKKTELLLRDSEERYRILTENSLVGVYLVQDGLFQYVNPAFARIHGYKTEEMIGKLGPMDLVIPEEREKEAENIRKRVEGERDNTRLELLMKRKDGTIRTVEAFGSRILYNERPAIMGTLLDITEKKQLEEKLQMLSIVDELTKLYNRRGFFSISNQQIKIANRSKKEMMLFYIDLDDMKWINDNLGHQEGDRALIDTARILLETFRESDVIGRIGGDEFAVLAVGSNNFSSKMLCQRLQRHVDSYNRQRGKTFKLSLSVGTAFYEPENPCNLDELVSKADNLMYIDKKRKKGNPAVP